MAVRTKAQKAEQQEARDRLREMLRPGDTIHAVLRHVSASGMRRHIDFYVIRDNDLVYLTGYMATALDYPRENKRGSMVVDGAGMDMGFHIVHSLASVLYTNADGSYSHDGAYSLKHNWI